MSDISMDEYDGFYILPGDDEEDPGGINLAFFKFKEEFFGNAVESSAMGDKYHVAFFRRDANGDPMFDEEFEAIFCDPAVYAKQLVGSYLYGCILRKTEKSIEWWKEYMNRAQTTCVMNKLIKTSRAILESKT